jgi:hypothetical protein
MTTVMSIQKNVIFPTQKVMDHDICEVNFVVSSMNVEYVMFIVSCIALKLQFDIGCATNKDHKKTRWQQEEKEQQKTPFLVIIVILVKKKHNNNNRKKKKKRGIK